MAWFGKLLGGSLGFFAGGPLGAILGAAIGGLFDKEDDFDNYKKRDYRDTTMSGQEKAQAAFFVTTFSLLGKIVHADGEFSVEEDQAFQKVIQDQFRLNPNQAKLAYEIFLKAASPQYQYMDLLKQFYQLFQTDQQMLNLQLDLMVRLAVADNHFHEYEKSMLNQAQRVFQISDADYENILKRYVIASQDKYYAVLGCSPQDDNDTIKSKYRQLALENHPDKVIAKGLPEEFVQYANKKFQEIQEAYEAVKKARNIA